MKNHRLLYSVFTLIFLAMTFISSKPAQLVKWKKIGSKKVDLIADFDRINLTVKDGAFRALKIKVRRSPINIDRMVVHYQNGEKEKINLRSRISKGGESRVIDLKGNKRLIDHIDFWYDTVGLINNKAIVEVYGKR